MKTVVCGIDSSTQSCTVVTRDPDSGKVIDFSSDAHPRTSPPKSEQDPASWLKALKSSLRKVSPENIGALSIDGQGHGSVLLDKDAEVLRPAKLWNNTETRQESDELIKKLGVRRWIELTSIVPVPAFTITKLLWIKRNEPEVLEKCRHILLPHDWLIYKLTGFFATDRSEASGTGYFSPATSSWHPEILDMVDKGRDWESMLPHVAGPNEIVGTVTTAASKEMGIHSGIPLAPGCNDNPASALGIGLRQTDVCISLGTSGTVFVPSAEPVFDMNGYVNGNADATGAFLPLVCTLNATKVTDWIARLLGVDHQKAAQMALSAPAKADRPILIPYLDGERTPNVPLATGVIRGLKTDTSAEGLVRACYEGVLLGLASGLHALRDAGVDTSGRVILTGGGAASPAYIQLLADIIERPVWISHETRSASLGAAVQAAAVFHNCRVTEIRDQWAPKLEIRATPRLDQSVHEIRDRYNYAEKQEVMRATSEIA